MSKAPPITPLINVMIGDSCVGYLIRRGAAGFEAFTADDCSLGTFTDERDAIAAVIRGESGDAP